MERKRKVGVACLIFSFPVGILSLGFFMEEAANAATFAVPSWVGLIAAVRGPDRRHPRDGGRAMRVDGLGVCRG